MIGTFDLTDDQALILEIEAPDARYWSIHTLDHWFGQLDYANYHVSLNGSQTHVDDDGRIRIVVTRNDPGVANWLDTCGVQHGIMMWRTIQASSEPSFTYSRRADSRAAGRTAGIHPLRPRGGQTTAHRWAPRRRLPASVHVTDRGQVTNRRR